MVAISPWHVPSCRPVTPQDLWSVYAGRHGLIESVNEEDLYIRTSNSDRTYQVTGGLLFGMDPNFPHSFQVHTQPSNVGHAITEL